VIDPIEIAKFAAFVAGLYVLYSRLWPCPIRCWPDGREEPDDE